MNLEGKQRLHAHCLVLLDEKITFIHRLLDDLKNGTANDAKSSAGDKHETAISMMQLEQEKLNAQLHQLVSQKNIAQKTPVVRSEIAQKGTVIITTKGIFYLLAPLAKIAFEGIEILCLSATAPLSIQMMGKKVGEQFVFGANTYHITKII
jgi:hypothetical protein